MQETQLQSLSEEDPLEKEWQPTSVFLPEESYGQRSRRAIVHDITNSRTQLSD